MDYTVYMDVDVRRGSRRILLEKVLPPKMAEVVLSFVGAKDEALALIREACEIMEAMTDPIEKRQTVDEAFELIKTNQEAVHTETNACYHEYKQRNQIARWTKGEYNILKGHKGPPPPSPALAKDVQYLASITEVLEFSTYNDTHNAADGTMSINTCVLQIGDLTLCTGWGYSFGDVWTDFFVGEVVNDRYTRYERGIPDYEVFQGVDRTAVYIFLYLMGFDGRRSYDDVFSEVYFQDSSSDRDMVEHSLVDNDPIDARKNAVATYI